MILADECFLHGFMRISWKMMISEETVGSVSYTLENLLTSKALVGEYKNIKSLAECPQTELSAFYREIVDKGLDWVEMPIDKKDFANAERGLIK